MREDGVGWDIIIGGFAKNEVAVGFALQEAHRDAQGAGWARSRTNATQVAR
jgi:hypothetical protein